MPGHRTIPGRMYRYLPYAYFKALIVPAVVFMRIQDDEMAIAARPADGQVLRIEKKINFLPFSDATLVFRFISSFISYHLRSHHLCTTRMKSSLFQYSLNISAISSGLFVLVRATMSRILAFWGVSVSAEINSGSSGVHMPVPVLEEMTTGIP